jgi:hypothetical protein
MRKFRRHILLWPILISTILSWSIYLSGESFTATIDLDLPTDVLFNVIKIGPQDSIYALSYLDGRLAVQPKDSGILEIDLKRDAPCGNDCRFFDFSVGEDGTLYILSLWRSGKQDNHAGVLVYNREGDFKELIELSRYVDARRILVDARGRFIVLGLDPALYFGKAEALGLIHRYGPDGRYLDTLYALDWRQYVPSGMASLSIAYNTLRPLVDRLPLVLDAEGNILTAYPGRAGILILEGPECSSVKQIDLPLDDIALDLGGPCGGRSFPDLPAVVSLQPAGDHLVVELALSVACPDSPRPLTGRARLTVVRSTGAVETVESVAPQTGTLLERVALSSDTRLGFLVPQAEGARVEIRSVASP